jgi:hypothetical protein
MAPPFLSRGLSVLCIAGTGSSTFAVTGGGLVGEVNQIIRQLILAIKFLHFSSKRTLELQSRTVKRRINRYIFWTLFVWRKNIAKTKKLKISRPCSRFSCDFFHKHSCSAFLTKVNNCDVTTEHQTKAIKYNPNQTTSLKYFQDLTLSG